MPEKITVNAMTLIGAEIARRKLSEMGIKFNAHQEKVVIATLTSVFVSGSATALKMVDDGHDLSDVQQLAAQVSDQIRNQRQ